MKTIKELCKRYGFLYEEDLKQLAIGNIKELQKERKRILTGAKNKNADKESMLRRIDENNAKIQILKEVFDINEEDLK